MTLNYRLGRVVETPLALPFPPPYLAFHGLDVPYAFQNTDLIYDAIAARPGIRLPVVIRDRILEGRMLAYWSGFARTGNPNSASRPFWPAYDRPGEAYQVLEAYPYGGTRYHHAGCDVYDRIYGAGS